jgi:uncharacterized protein (TIGR02996 family)
MTEQLRLILVDVMIDTVVNIMTEQLSGTLELEVSTTVTHLYEQLLTEPNNNSLRLILADAYEECDHVIYANFIRTQVRIFELEQHLKHKDNRVIRGKLVQLQNLITEKELARKKLEFDIAKLKIREKSLMEQLQIKRVVAKGVVPEHDIVMPSTNFSLALRELARRYVFNPEEYIRLQGVRLLAMYCKHERGFVSWIRCTTQWMIDNLAKLVKKLPIITVEINDANFQTLTRVGDNGLQLTGTTQGGYFIPVNEQTNLLIPLDQRDRMIISNLRKVYPTVTNWILV